MFENVVPLLFENDSAELCFELFIWRQGKVRDPVTFFSFCSLLEKVAFILKKDDSE